MLNPGFHNLDCMDGMREFPDGYFDLAVVDPPYGGGAARHEPGKISGGGPTSQRESGAGSVGGLTATILTNHATSGIFKRYERPQNGGIFDPARKCSHWDIAPTQEYFNELARVSKNQIIWGANYFDLPPTRCFLVWRKLTISESFSMAMCEYAWTSFNDNAKWIELPPQGRKGQDRIHPTQKPVALYTWILNNYAKPGDRILDTHVGSASSLIACHRLGLEYVGFEIDTEYYRMAKERLEKEKEQLTIFEATERQEQGALF